MAALKNLLRASPLAVLGLILAACGDKEPPIEWPPLQDTTQVELPEAIKYCRSSALPIHNFAAQILFDSSGSMRGFNAFLTSLEEWNQQALSHLRDPDTVLRDQRFCFFSANDGISHCGQGRFGVSSIPSGGNTSLDDAIRRSQEYDLTVVLTDGVAATVDKTSDCAGGVDPSCVARALFAAIQPSAGSSREQVGGIWMIPMAALFDGVYYTETRTSVDSFRASTATDAVLRDTGTNAVIRDVRADRSGKLYYNYQGPRLLAELVIAKNAELGRAYISSLDARRESTAIQFVPGLESFRNGIAALPPVEIYPGYVPSVEWDSVHPETWPDGGANIETGVVSAALDKDFLKLGPTGSKDEALLDLRGHAQYHTDECTEIRQLPPMRVQRLTGGKGVSPSPLDGQFVQKAEWKSVTSPFARLHISASKDQSAPCDGTTPTVEWQTSPTAPSEGRLRTIGAFATNDPVNEPDRIYGLSDMLGKFFQEMQSTKAHWATFARLRPCQT